MDVEWSTVVELEHLWYQGVTLCTISRGAEHNSKSYHLSQISILNASVTIDSIH